MKTDFTEMREKLFGDVPLSEWKAGDGTPDTAEPWVSFEAARVALAAGESGSAVDVLRRVAGLPGLESRQYLQTWHFLRGLGVQPPPDKAALVLGVVLEVQLKAGLDTLAAYADHSARYINHAGKVIVWELSEDDMNGHIDELLQAGQHIVAAIGPSDEKRRGAPPKGHVRINMLTASGLHFGEGPFEVLSEDPMGGPVLAAGTQLMEALIGRVEASNG